MGSDNETKLFDEARDFHEAGIVCRSPDILTDDEDECDEQAEIHRQVMKQKRKKVKKSQPWKGSPEFTASEARDSDSQTGGG